MRFLGDIPYRTREIPWFRNKSASVASGYVNVPESLEWLSAVTVMTFPGLKIPNKVKMRIPELIMELIIHFKNL